MHPLLLLIHPLLHFIHPFTYTYPLLHPMYLLPYPMYPLWLVSNIDVHVGLDMGRLIQQARQKKGLSQKDLAAVSTTDKFRRP